MTLSVTAMRLLRIPESFDNSDGIFEPKMDGFRALAHVTGHRCTLVSRNGHVFKSWPQLAEEIRTASARTAPFSTAKSAASNRMGRAISRICYSGVSGRSSWRSTCPPWAAATSAPCGSFSGSARAEADRPPASAGCGPLNHFEHRGCDLFRVGGVAARTRPSRHWLFNTRRIASPTRELL